MQDPIQEWLNEYTKENTRLANQQGLNKFCEAMNLTPEQLAKLPPKELRKMVLQFQAKMLEKYKPNSVVLYIATVKSFLEYNGVALKIPKRKLVKKTKARGYHTFSNGDLAKIFKLGGTQMRAVIATLCSTGWAISDVLALPKELMAAKLANSKDGFIFFEWSRKKTGSEALCILNPLACEWVREWLRINENGSLFQMTYDAVDYNLKQLAEKAIPHLEGRVRIHNIRKWTINSLVKAGFSTEEWKYIVGKSISQSDDTYLNLKPIIEEKYPRKYSQYLAIMKPQVSQTRPEELQVYKETLERMAAQIAESDKEQTIKIQGQRKRIEELEKQTNDFRDILPIVYDRLFIDFEKARIKKDITIPRFIAAYRKLVKGLENKRDKTEEDEEMTKMLAESEETLEYWELMQTQQEDLATKLKEELNQVGKLILALTKRKKLKES